jgi:F420-non-reducing hydrogenase small subunit
MNTRFAVLQLSGCSGCEVTLLNADDWIGRLRLEYMPLVLSSEDFPHVQTLFVSGAVYTDEDLYRLRQAAQRAERIVAVGTCAISGGVANLGYRDEVRAVFFGEMERRHVPRNPAQAARRRRRGAGGLLPPGCPPTPQLYMMALGASRRFRGHQTVCIDWWPAQNARTGRRA